MPSNVSINGDFFMGPAKVQFQLLVLALYCISLMPIIPQSKQIWGGRQITLVNLNLKQYFFLLKVALNRDMPHSPLDMLEFMFNF